VGFADETAQREPEVVGDAELSWRAKLKGLERAIEARWVLRFLRTVFEKNFQKVLDDAAKADQNLASLLLMAEAIATV
jgi:hypothetical protein